MAAFVGDVVALPATLRGGVAECALGWLWVATPTADGRVTVLLRPEQITLDAGDRGVPAHVVDVEYFGHDAVVRLELGAAGEITARCPGYALPAIGAQVRLVVRGEVGVEPSR